jgi:hypothetical protein
MPGSWLFIEIVWPRRESNPHASYPALDFKSKASAIPPLGRLTTGIGIGVTIGCTAILGRGSRSINDDGVPRCHRKNSHKSRGPIFFYSPRASGVRAKKIKGRLKYFRTLGQADDAGAPHARTHFQPQVAKVISDETRSPGLLVSEFRMLVDVASPLTHFLLQSRSAFPHLRFERGDQDQVPPSRIVW